MQDWREEKRFFLITMAPPTLWFLFFFAVPMSLVWLYSFGETTGLMGVKVSGTFSNYARALDPLIFKVLLDSIWIAALITLICLVAAFPIALAMTFAKQNTKAWLLMLIMLPFWTNLLIRTYAMISVLGTNGLINSGASALHGLLGGLGLPMGVFEPMPLLYNKTAVIIGLVYVHLPFMVLPLYAALDRLDKSLIEASLDLGAGHFQTMMRVVVPLALPGIIAGIIITFIPALGSYLTPEMLGGPNDLMIASLIERQFKRANDWPFGSALSFLLMYITLLFFIVRAMVDKESARRGAH